jgi:hypothetical protein
MRFSKSDFVPRLHDAGMDSTILTAFASSITLEALTSAVNAATEWELSAADVVHYISERGGLGLTVTGGSLKAATPRPDAPTGLGVGDGGVWFSTPDEGVATVRWYVNGALAIEREQDLSTNRSATLTELGAGAGDTIQVAILDGDTVGWWAQIEI